MSDTQLDPNVVGEWLKSVKTLVDVAKGVSGLIPKGPDRAKIDAALEDVERAAGKTDAALAKALGYNLCQCAFPPPIMLWNEQRHAHVCPNPECGRAISPPPAASRAPGRTCPSCGEAEYRAVKTEPMAGIFGTMGARQVTLRCRCGFEDVETTTPK